MPRYILYAMDVEPTHENCPIGMNDILGIGDYHNWPTALRILRPKRAIVRFSTGKPAQWLAVYNVPHPFGVKEQLVYKERLCPLPSTPSSPPTSNTPTPDPS